MEIPSASQANKALLGEGYNSEEESFVGECVTGTVEFVGAQESSVVFSRSLSATETADSLGFSIGASARYGLYKGSMSARFASEASANNYSEVTVYSAQYRFKNRKLKYTGLTAVGEAAKGFSTDNNFVGENWVKVCGHEYVEQVTLGATLFISAKIEFSSRSKKQEFNLQFKVKGPAFSVSSELEKASKLFGSTASITIQAYQIGGDISRVSAIFGTGSDAKVTSPDGKNVHAILVCSMTNPSACLKVLDNALFYATDTQDPSAFPQQIRPDSDFGNTNNPNGPAELSYITNPWSNLALISPPPIISDAIKAAREDLSLQFEINLKYRNRVRSLLTGPIRLSQSQRANIEEIDIIISDNLKLIYETAIICYTKLDECVEKVAQTNSKLKTVDELKLEIVPESLAQWYDTKDLPSTRRSIQQLLNTLGEKVRKEVVDFDKVDDKSAVVEQVLTQSKELSIPFNSKITDLDPLASLTNLTKLDLSFNEITDLKPLESLVNLEWLGLANNQVANLKPLSKLNNLALLSLEGNRIDDLNPISQLKNLKLLALGGNNIVDIKPLALLINLENLFLWDNKITDVSSLASLTNLKNLNLMGNPLVSKICPIPDPQGKICQFADVFERDN
ncbi:MAG: leucine-rich repeat domain-containing protein [Oscillatoriaceae cyanobacterium Prado104]|nr:leucine-rich repeat domain-containing protein [Oscillatoriaceae cyanobacterium Prado104]